MRNRLFVLVAVCMLAGLKPSIAAPIATPGNRPPSASIEQIYWARDPYGRRVWIAPRRYYGPPPRYYHRPYGYRPYAGGGWHRPYGWRGGP